MKIIIASTSRDPNWLDRKQKQYLHVCNFPVEWLVANFPSGPYLSGSRVKWNSIIAGVKSLTQSCVRIPVSDVCVKTYIMKKIYIKQAKKILKGLNQNKLINQPTNQHKGVQMPFHKGVLVTWKNCKKKKCINKEKKQERINKGGINKHRSFLLLISAVTIWLKFSWADGWYVA